MHKQGLYDVKFHADKPTLLFQDGDHAVYWLGISDQTAFRCNVYLIRDGDEAIIMDPGSRRFFDQVKARVAQIMPPEQVTGMVLCHQDPDVAASMVDWLDLIPNCTVMTSPRSHVLLPHFGKKDYDFYDVEEHPQYRLPSGSALQFITAPHLHSPAALTTLDGCSHYLFTGDIWAALSPEWELTVQDFDAHALSMDLFHVDYMASNIAANGFINKIEGLAIDALLPQHGSIIGPDDVAEAYAYLRDLRCGTDLAYPDLE